MTLAEHHELARNLLGAAAPREDPPPRVVTCGPGDEDWAVVEDEGSVSYVGPALFAARFAARRRSR